MTVTLSLAPSGSLRLGLPSGRFLDVTASEAGVRVIQEVLRNAAEYRRGEERKGYIRAFPTQHVIDTWLRADAKQQAVDAKDRAEAEAASMGIDLQELEFKL